MMDNIREKLVELICKVQDYGEKTKHLNGSYAFVERNDNRTIADHLIANGVTIKGVENDTVNMVKLDPLETVTPCHGFGEWIPVTERLPIPNTWVMVYRRSVGNIGGYTSIEYLAFLHGETTAWSNDFETWKSVVTHWMPLPIAPKGE